MTALCLAILLTLSACFAGENECQKNVVFPEISCDDTYALKKTGRLRGDNGWSSFYPEVDISQISELPVYGYKDDYSTLKERILENTRKLSLDISDLTENVDSYFGDDNCCVYSGKTEYIAESDDGSVIFDSTYTYLSASDRSFYMSIHKGSNNCSDMIDTRIGQFPASVDYEITNDGLVLSEKSIRLYTDKCEKYLKMLNKENYVLYDIENDYHARFSDYITPDYPDISTTLTYYPPREHERACDTLLDYYNLNSCVKFTISYYINPTPNYGELLDFEIALTIIDTDWMNKVGEYEIIPITKANYRFNNNEKISYCKESLLEDTVDFNKIKEYDTYLVYVEDSGGFIRPIYLKQDYYSVGELYNAAWIDAISY